MENIYTIKYISQEGFIKLIHGIRSFEYNGEELTVYYANYPVYSMTLNVGVLQSLTVILES